MQTTWNRLFGRRTEPMRLSTQEDTQCPESMASADVPEPLTPVIFYGVFVPKEKHSPEDGNESGVFTDKTEALSIAKKNRGTRFNSFKTFDEALSFSKQTTEQLTKSIGSTSTDDDSQGCPLPANTATLVEKGTAFRGPKTTDSVKLRKAIESGDAEYFNQCVWSNPRYLISSGDTPAVLQEGSRYNALHAAAKAKQPTMCRLILDTIEDTQFMKLLYSDDSDETTCERTAFLVDLYLNMPDKGASETPLHFASKFGCLKIVEMLVLHAKCNRTQLNKYGQTPREIACSRCPQNNQELKRQIENAFEDRYYVPVWDCENHTIPPYIGEPVSPSKHESFSKMLSGGGSPVGVSLVVRALAGPMSPKQAKDLYKQWKTPPFPKCGATVRSCPPQLDIKLSDTDKGLERIGRQLAENGQLEWVERWPFLGEFCNLKKPDGLSKLETYLRNKYRELMETNRKLSVTFDDDERDELLSRFEPSTEGSLWNSSSQNSSMGRLCDSFDRLQIRGSPKSPKKSVTKHRSRHSIPVPNLRNTSPLPLPPEMFVPPKNGDHPPPMSSQQLATGQMLDRLCHQVARVVTQELKERVRHNGASRRDFMLKVRPGLECLLRVVRDCQRLKFSEGSGLSCEKVDATNVHDTIAGLVATALKNDSAFSEETTTGYGGDALAALAATSDIVTSSEEESSGEEDFSRWRGGAQPITGADEAAAIKLTVQRHLTCVLSRVATRHGGQGTQQTTCTCEWNTGDGKMLTSAAKLQSSPPFIRRGMVCSTAAEDQRLLLLAKPKWKHPLNASTPIKFAGIGVGNRCHSSGSANQESGDDSNSSLESYFTPPSSYLSSESSSYGEVFTPDEGLVVFINGLNPTKCDTDVLRALDNVIIDPTVYPHVARWKEVVSSHTKEQIASWPTPTSVRTRISSQRHSAISNLASPLLLGRKPRRSENDYDNEVLDLPKLQAGLFKSIFSN